MNARLITLVLAVVGLGAGCDFLVPDDCQKTQLSESEEWTIAPLVRAADFMEFEPLADLPVRLEYQHHICGGEAPLIFAEHNGTTDLDGTWDPPTEFLTVRNGSDEVAIAWEAAGESGVKFLFFQGNASYDEIQLLLSP